jgi:hypothetical protein
MHVKIVAIFSSVKLVTQLFFGRSVTLSIEGAVVGDRVLGRYLVRKASAIALISGGTHHDDQDQGCTRRGARRLCCANRHGTPAYSSRAPPPHDPSVWIWQCIPVWQRLPMVSRSRIWNHPSAIHSSLSGLELCDRRRPRPIPSMRHGGLTGSYFLAITDPLVVIRSLKPESSGPVTTESFRRGSFGPTSSVPSPTLKQQSRSC